MQISSKLKKILKDLSLILIMILAYAWKGIPLLASFIVGWIMIKKFAKAKEDEELDS